MRMDDSENPIVALERTPRQLRIFALRVLIFCTISGWVLFHKHAFRMFIWWGLGGTFFLSALCFPKVAAPLREKLHGLQKVFEKVLTFILLVIIFYFVFTPLAWGARKIGKKFLDLAINGDEKTYWIPKENRSRDKSSYETTY